MSHQPGLGQPLLGQSQSSGPQATDYMHSKTQRFYPNPLEYILHPPLDIRGPEMAVSAPAKDTQRVGSSPGDHIQPPASSTCYRPCPRSRDHSPGFRWCPAHATEDRVGRERDSEGSI